MAEAIVSFVARKLGDLIVQEAQFLGEVPEKVKSVQRELENIRCYLRDADSKGRKGDARAEHWLNELRDAANHIEDATDTFYLELEHNNHIQQVVEDDNNCLQKYCFFFFGLVKKMEDEVTKLPSWHILGTELDSIKKDLEKIFESKDRYGIQPMKDEVDGSRESAPVILPKRTAAYQDVDETEVVGLDTDKNNILQQLRNREEKPRRAVITIIGEGGLGKTTLARIVYNSVKVDFQYHIMLSVSQLFSLTDLMIKMLNELIDSVPVNKDEGYYVAELKRLLNGKRYLIILDDVWDVMLWDQLQNALPDVKNGSRVLMTSRSIDVAKSADSEMRPHELVILNDKDSLNLLLKKALPYQECPRDLFELAEKLSKKCKGLPLALIVLGSILSKREHEYNHWKAVLDTIDWHKEGNDCMKVLAMSYEHMPYDLKLFFLYLASFPEDYEISARSLIRMWIAEGFIAQENRKTMEQTAEVFLEQLFERSMVQVSSRYSNGSIKYCRVHDLLRDLAMHEAGKENFVTVFSKLDQGINNHLSRETRRASLQSDDCREFIKFVGPKTRSLLWFDLDQRTLPYALTLEMVEFRLVRILEIMKVGQIVLRGLDRLIHLKYLRITLCYMLVIPNDFSWGRLKNLETLIVQRAILMQNNSSPRMKDLWTIGTLRHVKVDQFDEGPPANANLRNLQTLKWIHISKIWSQLPHLSNLQNLGFRIGNDGDNNNIDGNRVSHLLGDLPHLVSLRIDVNGDDVIPKELVFLMGIPKFDNLETLQLDGSWPKDVKTLEARMFPPHLLKLVLGSSNLGQDPMPELGKLKGLKKLVLQGYVYIGGKEMICPAGFLVLQTLILRLFGIESFTVMQGVMPQLKHFRNHQVDTKINMPLELKHFSNQLS